MGDPATTFEGTLQYMSIQQKQVGLGEIPHYDHFKADVFGLGMTIYAVATLKQPEAWATTTFEEKIRSKVPLLSYSQAIKDLLLIMLLEDEQRRATMQEVLEIATKWWNADVSSFWR